MEDGKKTRMIPKIACIKSAALAGLWATQGHVGTRQGMRIQEAALRALLCPSAASICSTHVSLTDEMAGLMGKRAFPKR